MATTSRPEVAPGYSSDFQKDVNWLRLDCYLTGTSFCATLRPAMPEQPGRLPVAIALSVLLAFAGCDCADQGTDTPSMESHPGTSPSPSSTFDSAVASPAPTATCAPGVAPVECPFDPLPPAGREFGTLDQFWVGEAEWVLETYDVGLPVGESDTIHRGGLEFWSYLHASFESAGVVDQCGDPAPFPGCVTLWKSYDGGLLFELEDPVCLFPCAACPCQPSDQTISLVQRQKT